MDHDVLILFTMDVEPVAKTETASGPRNDAEGMQRVQEYMEVLGDYGYTPTFFIHPELGRTQSKDFLNLKQCGACLGLHIHAAKFGHAVELGALSYQQQHKTLAAGKELFEQYFGFSPEIFRPGCFSANDCTYTVLRELGFKGGSICIPGRIWPERFCVWAGAYPHPHYANENFRQLPGNSTFVEIPLSVDRSKLHQHPLGFDYYFDLRPGDVYTSENVVPRDHQKVLANIVKQLAEEQPKLKTIVVDVHNDRNFKDLSLTPAQQLHTVLENLKPELAKYGFKPVNATYDQAIRAFRTL